MYFPRAYSLISLAFLVACSDGTSAGTSNGQMGGEGGASAGSGGSNEGGLLDAGRTSGSGGMSGSQDGSGGTGGGTNTGGTSNTGGGTSASDGGASGNASDGGDGSTGGSRSNPSSDGGVNPDARSTSDGAADAPGDARSAAADGGVSSDIISAGVRWVGRVDISTPDQPRFAWSGSGLVARVSGATIAVRLTTQNSSDPIYFQPVIDGTPAPRFPVPTGDQTITVASGLPAVPHTVEIYRETEGKFGFSIFKGFSQGTLLDAPAGSGRMVEIVGDSISAGYGNLGSEQHPNGGPDPTGGCVFTTQTESAYMAYGAQVARALDADVSVLAASGWGAYRDNLGNLNNVLSTVYSNTLGTQSSPPWSFVRKPQAVVINLGTNDFALSDPGATNFENAYTNLLMTIRSKYPDAYIFCALGPLMGGTGLASARSDIQAVIASANARGDSKVRFIEFPPENTTLGTGCQYHPNVAEDSIMAGMLAPAIRTALGW